VTDFVPKGVLLYCTKCLARYLNKVIVPTSTLSLLKCSAELFALPAPAIRRNQVIAGVYHDIGVSREIVLELFAQKDLKVATDSSKRHIAVAHVSVNEHTADNRALFLVERLEVI